MIERIKGIVFAVILALVMPVVILMLARNIQKEHLSSETKPSVAAEQFDVSVLTENELVEQMDINEYLTGVVLSEMPASFEFEALKAQSVVARTYVLRRSNGHEKHGDAAVCVNSSCCQGYKSVDRYLAEGGKPDDVIKIQKAVCETDGLVLTYQGDLIDATYFSCSGGMTEDASAVWGEDVPYLQSTTSLGEENARHYMDTVTFPVGVFAELLSIDEKQFRFQGIKNITYTAGGGVDTITICDQEFKGTEFRKKLNLKSTAFVISVVGDTVTITTKGYGHRVGMSQYGADAMAVSGSKFTEILKHYYKDVDITEMEKD